MSICCEPAVGARVQALCFGLADDEERVDLEAHLLVCDACWAEIQRLSEVVRVLRAETGTLEHVMATDLIELTGLGGRLRRPLAGHGVLVAAASAAYGLLMALSLLVEVSYQWSTYSAWAAPVGVAVGIASCAVSLLAFWAVTGRVRTGQPHASGWFLLIVISWSAVAAAVIAPWLSAAPIVIARFQTMPGVVGWLKSVGQALELPLLALVPYQLIVSLQRELQEGRTDRVLRLLTDDPMRVTPRGVLFARPLVAGMVCVLFCGWWIIASAHLLENIQPGPFSSLFMAAEMTRAAIMSLALITVLLWYLRLLNDLKREAIALAGGRQGLQVQVSL
jgi:hypothetical protein